MSKRIQYIDGQLLNGIVFIREIFNHGYVKRRGRFVCPFCGTGFNSTFNNIQTGEVVSCGCWQKFIAGKSNAILRTTHGLTNHTVFRRWRSIKDRCYNENNDAYHNYGGRGITVCDEWLDSFQVFYDYVMSLDNALGNGLTIDRKNNDGNYEPNNIRWATKKEQSINQRLRSSNKTGYRGVWEKRNGVFEVAVNKCYVGTYSDKMSAVGARNKYVIDNSLSLDYIQEYRG